jgi:hypothetical protein
MPTQYDLECRWISSEGIPAVEFRYGDIVKIKAGDHAGFEAQVISLYATEPEPLYGVTFPPNEKFAWIRQQDLEGTGTNSGATLILKKRGEPDRKSSRT